MGRRPVSTVTAIAEALVAVLRGLSWVDAASASEYLPSAVGSQVCAFVVPYNQETRALPSSLDDDTMTLTHVLTVEFWIQHRNGQAATTMQQARDAGTLAIAALLAHDGEGYTIAREYGFEERIDPAPVQHMNVPWLVSSLRVPVENEVTT